MSVLTRIDLSRIKLEIQTPKPDQVLRTEQAITAGTRLATSYFRMLVLKRTPIGNRSWRGHSAGNLMRSWSSVKKTGGMTFTLENIASYAGIVEWGSYKSVGPRTVAFGEGIYSTQAVGGMFTPLYDDPAVMKEVVEVAIKEVIQELRK